MTTISSFKIIISENKNFHDDDNKGRARFQKFYQVLEFQGLQWAFFPGISSWLTDVLSEP